MPKTYISCGCFCCRHAPTVVKKADKRVAHRLLRRLTKRAIRNRDEDDDVVIPQSISTGYKS